MPEDVKFGNISAAALEKATGRNWEEWFALLDAAKASTLDHADIAAWLEKNHINNGWWAQSVTVGYEQARGLRRPNQKTDGFTVSVSKTIKAPTNDLYLAWTVPEQREQWLPNAGSITYTTANVDKNLRCRWPHDDSLLIVYFYGKESDRTQLVVQIEQMATAAEVEPKRMFWREALNRLQSAVEQR